MEIVYRKLTDLHLNPKNPRTSTPEAVKALAESIKANPAFFEARPILLSDRTGKLVIIGGERRSEAAALLKMKSVPTILMQGLTEDEEDEILFLDNTHVGKWDVKKLEKWDKSKLQKWGVMQEWKDDGKTKEKYTRKIESPVYVPKGEKPGILELVDTKKRDELVQRIKEEKLPADVKSFLLMAAERHLVFNYEKIAEYYAQSPVKIQRLFEDSALIIIDFANAIGGGYVKLCKDLIEQYEIENCDD